MKRFVAFCLSAMLFAVLGSNLSANDGPFAFSVDQKSESYTVTEDSRPVLTYRFGEVPLPAGSEAPHFGKGPTDYDGAYFSDGSAFGGPRSDYIQPLFGFQGEELTADYPKDHFHHRGLWWSWCEVRRGDKIGDIWAVCKIRAYPSEIKKMEADSDRAVLEAVNFWRYDDDPTDVVKETVVITVYKTVGGQGARRRTVDVDVTLEALVENMAITGRQKVDYGGYGGMTVRLNGGIENFKVRAVHPSPDSWNGDDASFVERVVDPDRFGDAAWLALFGDYPSPKENAERIATTLLMMEKKSTPLYPNNFRYYGTTCTSLAFPAKNIVPLEIGKPLVYRTRFVVCEGVTGIEDEKTLFDEYQGGSQNR